MAIAGLEKLKAMNIKKQIAFAYLTCERMYPNFVFFSENNGFGDPQIIREGINLIYRSIFDEHNIDKQQIETVLRMGGQYPRPK